jgi:hypothetical protein
MSDPLPYLRALQGPPAPAQAPAWPPRSRRGQALASGAVLAAALVLIGSARAVLGTRPPAATAPTLQPGWTARGAEPPPAVDLRLAVEHGSELARLRRDQPYAVGDRIYLQLAASAPSRVSAWVQQDGVVEPLGSLEATREPQQLRTEAGLVAYECTRPGTLEICASTGDDGTCEPPACSCWTLEVR